MSVPAIEPDSKYVTHYGERTHVGQSQVEGFVKGAEKLLLELDKQLKVLLNDGFSGIPSIPRGKKGGKGPVTLSDYLREIPEIESPRSATRNLTIDDLNGTLGSLLEKILLYTKLTTEEKMSELAQQRIETIKTDLERTHDELREKISKNLEAMKKAARGKLLMKIVGWIMAAALVAGAIFTGGAAIAGVIAVSAITMIALSASAATSVLMMILDETGTMEKWEKELAEKFKRQGLKNADLRAQLAIQLPLMIFMIGTGGFGASGLGQIFKSASSIAKVGMGIMGGTGLVMGGASTAQQIITNIDQYKAAMAGAAVSEAEAIVQLVQQMLDEAQEELEDILDKMQDLIGRMFEIIASSLDAQKEIAQKVGQMA